MQEEKRKNKPKIFHFMPCRNRDHTGKFLPKTPTTSLSHFSLLFSGSDPEEPTGETPKIYEGPIMEEEQENVPLDTMDEHRNGIGNEERREVAFPI